MISRVTHKNIQESKNLAGTLVGFVYLYYTDCHGSSYSTINKKGHIGIVEKAQETSSDTGMHDTVCLCHYCTS